MKDMKFSRSEQRMEVARIEKFRYGVLKTLKDFFFLVTYKKSSQKNIQDYYQFQHYLFECRKSH